MSLLRQSNAGPDGGPTLRYIGLAYAAENKPLDSHDVKVFPYEWLNMKDGELGTLTYDLASSGIDVENNYYTEKIELGDTIRATFLGRDNLDTSPDVRRGERLYLFQQGDSDRYYWETMGIDKDLRRLETVRYSWSDIPENVDEQVDASNSYYLEVSTHKGLVTFSTSTRNGEHTEYLMQFNCKDGQFTLKDAKENVIQLDSKANTLWLQNQEGSKVEINRKNLHLKAVNNMVLESPNISVKSDNFHLSASDAELSGGNLNIAYSAISQGPTKIETLEGPVKGTPLSGPIGSVASVEGYSGAAKPIAVPFKRQED